MSILARKIETQARFYCLLFIAQIVAQITILIGLFIFLAIVFSQLG